MTVYELIQKLAKYPPDATVWYLSDEDYTREIPKLVMGVDDYGSAPIITWKSDDYDFLTVEDEEDD